NIDVVVNLSFSPSSSYLTKLISAKHYLGLSRRNNNDLEIAGSWAQYIYATTMAGPLNPFSIIDLYQLMLSPPSDLAKNEWAVAAKNHPPAFDDTLWRPSTLPEDWPQRSFTLVVHPFASHGKKTWKIHKWGEVIYKIAKNLPHLKIVVVGGPNDVKDGHQLEDMALIKQVIHQIDWQIGKISLHQLFQILGSARLLLAPDSMAQQLAMFTSTPAVVLALGCVRPLETTSYAPYNLVLSPRRGCFPCFLQDACPDYACHAHLNETLVAQIVTEYISNAAIDLQKFTQDNSAYYREGISLWASEISPDGLFNLRPLIGGQDVRDIFRQLYRVAFAYDLAQLESNAPFPQISGNLRQLLALHQAGLKYLADLSQFGKQYSQAIIQELALTHPAMDKIQELTQKITEVEDLQNILKKTYPYLSPLIDLGLVRKAHLAGNNLVQIAEASFFTYEHSFCQAQIMHDLIQQTIEHYQNFARP
ncbi:MAG: hypothetical protein J6Y94_08575, partial [Bacteriovoracaceae bacterium]|nr:hypothetical protein [Bacteriovoracaceae bacterium]